MHIKFQKKNFPGNSVKHLTGKASTNDYDKSKSGKASKRRKKSRKDRSKISVVNGPKGRNTIGAVTVNKIKRNNKKKIGTDDVAEIFNDNTTFRLKVIKDIEKLIDFNSLQKYRDKVSLSIMEYDAAPCKPRHSPAKNGVSKKAINHSLLKEKTSLSLDHGSASLPTTLHSKDNNIASKVENLRLFDTKTPSLPTSNHKKKLNVGLTYPPTTFANYKRAKKRRDLSLLIGEKELNTATSVGHKNTHKNIRPTNDLNKVKSFHQLSSMVALAPEIPVKSLLYPDKNDNIRDIFTTANTASSDRAPPQYGWKWEGGPYYGYVLTKNSSIPHVRLCYPAIKHAKGGDILRIKDDVLIRSEISDRSFKGKADKRQVTCVGKIMAFWNHNGDMKMTIMWYYQKEHVEIAETYNADSDASSVISEIDTSFMYARNRGDHIGIKSSRNKFFAITTNQKCEQNFPFIKNGSPKELFASKHIDTLSVGCIEDKGFVFTYDAYCRLQAKIKFKAEPRLPTSRIMITCSSTRKIPSFQTLYKNKSNIYFCRRIYDPIYKRIIKNPTFRYA
ncbi:unnamed protein product [Gordionus sp. m RMFG-2023]